MTRSVFALILGSAVVKVLHRPCNRVLPRFDGTLAPLTCSSHANHPTGHPSAVPAWIWILPQSTKAQAMAAAVQRHRPSVQWWCPQLPPPAAALRLLLNGLTDWPLAAKGSQRPLWGRRWVGFMRRFWRVVCAGWRYLSIQRFIRRGTWPGTLACRPAGTTQHKHFFAPRFIDELQAMGSGRITAPAHTLTLTLIAQGDEVLDGREMAAFCTGAQVRLLQGSNHA